MSFRRLGWAALLAVCCLAFSAHYSRLAPCGAWGNHIFGEEAWGEADPGGFYFAAAHELAWGESPLFVCHPGATLLPLLRAVQSGFYHLGGEEGVSFTRFTALHLPDVFLASKLLMTGLHLVSFAALYGLASALLRDRHAAALATLGYATSLPVLYYLSRISVEPIQIACFAAAFLATFRYEDRAREGRFRAALVWAGLAAALAVSGAMSKLAFGGPLPLLLAAQIAFGGRASEPGGRIPARVRGLALAVFGAAGLAPLGLYSGIIDWSHFAGTWRAIARRPVGDGLQLSDLAPGLGSRRIYLAAELGFLAVAAAGLWLFLRERPEARRRALWLSAYGLYGLLFFGYRVVLEGNFLPFHYAFLLHATAAVFFGHASLRAWRRLRGPRSGAAAPAWAAAALWLALLHGVGVAAVADARRYDAEQFATRAPLFPLVAALEPGDRLGVVQRRWGRRALDRRLVSVHGFSFPVAFHPRGSRLAREFESFFVIQRSKRVTADTPRAFVPFLGANVVLVSGREPAP
jgi:hypothetical protein